MTFQPFLLLRFDLATTDAAYRWDPPPPPPCDPPPPPWEAATAAAAGTEALPP